MSPPAETAAETVAPVTARSLRKADRRDALVAAAAALFAERGFAGVTLEDLGSAAGVSGPAVYRHFPGKGAVLAAVLVDASRGLLDGGRTTVERAEDADGALRDLIAFHVDFAVANADVIRVQDQDLASLPDDEAHEVRRLQRAYVELWVDVLGRLRDDRPAAERRVRAHAAFGLINSTPHSARDLDHRPDDREVRAILEQMAWASLTA
ncbi:TetR/AcrR family transcriptional regulator [Agromyces sp. LHK192]|uniref:TetR/AcrR family transcriptional regulator n=1 Tax=Agromyces sp. LHK192 TaxID=2498704 RepID=UPI000FD72989|nr:TetR/AcrR family transcriptional regulator [Agromyces sp. LHK192]